MGGTGVFLLTVEDGTNKGGDFIMSKDNYGWASPAPAGLVALAIACFTFFALQTGRVEHSAAPLLGVWLLGGAIVQVIVGVIELREGQIVGGNVFTFFSAFFMFVTGSELLLKTLLASKGIAFDARMDGWAWLVLCIALTTWAPAYILKAAKSMAFLIIAITPAVWIVCLTDLTVIAKTWVPCAGWLLLITGIFGLYTAAAIVLNTTFGKAILPTGSPFMK